MTATRERLPTDRIGRTHKVQLGKLAMYVTVNRYPDGRPGELFGRAEEGYQPWLEDICILSSMLLQYGCPAEKIIEKMKGRRYVPHGGPGQPSSIADAVMRVLERENTAAPCAG